MTGIAALAAAAAATQKITGTTSGTTTSTPVSGIKVVTPTIVTPQGMKVTPIQKMAGKLIFHFAVLETQSPLDKIYEDAKNL